MKGEQGDRQVAQNARKQPARSSSGLKPFYIALGVIALAGAGWIAYSAATGAQRSAAMQPVSLEGLDDPEALMAVARGVSRGADTARVKILVFSDFTCPACRFYSTSVEPQLISEFVDAGRVQLVYYDFPLGDDRTPGAHRHAFVSARAARCADDQDRFWDFHDVLFAQQSNWALSPNPPLDRFREYAVMLGLDEDAFNECLYSDRFADVVSANRRLGESLNVSGTPSVYVGPRPSAAWNDWQQLRQDVMRALGGQ
jgi:protein-disulfide isomerase